jgi:hypothetical protein
MVMVASLTAKTTQKTTMNHGTKTIELPELALFNSSRRILSLDIIAFRVREGCNNDPHRLNIHESIMNTLFSKLFRGDSYLKISMPITVASGFVAIGLG